MKKYLKAHWRFLLFVLIGGLIGGYCMGMYGYDMLSEDTLAILREQTVTKEMVALSTMAQYGVLFGLVLAGHSHLRAAGFFARHMALIKLLTAGAMLLLIITAWLL